MWCPASAGPSDPPEIARQTDAREDGARLVRRRPAELRGEPGAVPLPREIPGLRQRHQRATRDVARGTPAVDVLLRPEEQDVRSREKNVVPEMRGGHEQMNHAVAVRAIVLDAARDRFAGPGARCVDPYVAVERRRDAECIPGARRE